MTDEELIETLKEFDKKRVEQLQEPAKNLFYAIMKIADERDRLNKIIKESIELLEPFIILGDDILLKGKMLEPVYNKLKGE